MAERVAIQWPPADGLETAYEPLERRGDERESMRFDQFAPAVP